jgi:hypothetical protein
MNLHGRNKLEMPTRTYNLKINHKCMTINTTCGHPGRWSDKTLVLFDDFVLWSEGWNNTVGCGVPTF